MNAQIQTLTILAIDNDPDFVNTRAEFLENAGYRVLKAYTLEQARQRLSDDYVHLAILDLRMVDDDDEKDTSGLTLAKDRAYQPVPKIILTNFPTYQAVRKALGPTLDGLPPAVGFLDKREGPEFMVKAVEQALAAYLHINRDLQIHWDAQQRLSFLYLVSLLQAGLPSDSLAQRAQELEDLFRRLFYDYQQVRIPRLFWHGDGRFCVMVLARSLKAATDARVVVCGEREPLGQEIKLVRELAPETLRGVRLDSTTETMHFGAVTYALSDADLEAVRPLRALFEDGKERPLKVAVNHLLTTVLSAWHQRGQIIEDEDLMALYRRRVGLGDGGLARVEVERRVDALVQMAKSLGPVEIERGGGTIVFRFPNEPPLNCPDPVATVYTPSANYGVGAQCCISPGQLTVDNVLVDGAQRTWLTGFVQAGQAPQRWDFIRLEAMVRFDLSQAPDLLAWQEFEECLTQSAQLHDRLRTQDVVSDLRTSVVLIEQIRRQAGSEAGPDLLRYETGLLVWAVAVMARYDPAMIHTQAERMRGGHLLLAAALLARRVAQPLLTPDETASLTNPLRLDADGVQVWRGERRIPDLGEQELALFRCLYERAGQVVPRLTLVEQGLGEKYVPDDSYQEGRLNALVRRLRIKIEPDPTKRRHLFTSRGKGLRLKTGDD